MFVYQRVTAMAHLRADADRANALHFRYQKQRWHNMSFKSYNENIFVGSATCTSAFAGHVHSGMFDAPPLQRRHLPWPLTT